MGPSILVDSRRPSMGLVSLRHLTRRRPHDGITPWNILSSPPCLIDLVHSLPVLLHFGPIEKSSNQFSLSFVGRRLPGLPLRLHCNSAAMEVQMDQRWTKRPSFDGLCTTTTQAALLFGFSLLPKRELSRSIQVLCVVMVPIVNNTGY